MFDARMSPLSCLFSPVMVWSKTFQSVLNSRSCHLQAALFCFFFARMNAFHFLSLPSCPGLLRIFSLAYGSKMNLEFLFSQKEKVRTTSFMVEGENQLLKADLWSYMCHDMTSYTEAKNVQVLSILQTNLLIFLFSHPQWRHMYIKRRVFFKKEIILRCFLVFCQPDII